MNEPGWGHVFQAAPFGFGPVSTTLAIADHLRRAGVAIVWLADGVAPELLETRGSTRLDRAVLR